MKLTLEPTDRFETIDGRPHRVWKGTNETGTPVLAYVRAVSPQTHDEAAIAAFDRELLALPQPRRELVSFDLRMVL
jgi:hypothetical protein